ncbi:hypothetical protein H5410_046486 [Solanum commersonii]|uniref:ATP-dependent DNA helicase n=1 Tax=Solanum commersonii TaxID=4109 RepID=A0A9J5XFN3_SOLCO|nr:hypothetical protein H5410_046486 [Solanum commersonii]
MGQSVDKYDIPQIKQQLHQIDPRDCREIIEERNVNVPVEDAAAQSKLNQQQTQAFTTILERVNSETQGKTFLYRALLAKVRSKGLIALACATSGVAATLLPGGRTTHSRFGIPLQANETTMAHMSKQGDRVKLIRKAKLIIWDETPMAKRSFHDIMDKDAPFGGKVMVFGGDFRQVLPIVPNSIRAEMVDASLVRLYLWPLMEKIQLSTNMRARTDTTFSEFLLHIGNGEETTIKENLIALPQQMIVQQSQDGNLEETLDSLKPKKSYYIAKGRLDRVNPNYYCVHKEVELAFTDNTIIKAADIEVSTHKFSIGFVSLDHVNKLPNGAILVSMNPLIEKEYSKKQGIFVTNEHYVLKMSTINIEIW